MPMSASCVVNRGEVLDLLDELRDAAARGAPPRRVLLADREAVVDEGSREADAELIARGAARSRPGWSRQTEVLIEAARGRGRPVREAAPSEARGDAATRSTTTSTPSSPTSRSCCRQDARGGAARPGQAARPQHDDELRSVDVGRAAIPSTTEAAVTAAAVRLRRLGSPAAAVRYACGRLRLRTPETRRCPKRAGSHS